MTTSWQHIDWTRTILLVASLLLVMVAIITRLRNLRPAQRETFLRFWHNNIQELVGIPAALLIFWISGGIIRWWDSEAGSFDAGVLHQIPHINAEWFANGNSKFTRQWLFVIYLAAYCLLSL
jgi:hypothetical protein